MGKVTPNLKAKLVDGSHSSFYSSTGSADAPPPLAVLSKAVWLVFLLQMFRQYFWVFVLRRAQPRIFKKPGQNDVRESFLPLCCILFLLCNIHFQLQPRSFIDSFGGGGGGGGGGK